MHILVFFIKLTDNLEKMAMSKIPPGPARLKHGLCRPGPTKTRSDFRPGPAK